MRERGERVALHYKKEKSTSTLNCGKDNNKSLSRGQSPSLHKLEKKGKYIKQIREDSFSIIWRKGKISTSMTGREGNEIKDFLFAPKNWKRKSRLLSLFKGK